MADTVSIGGKKVNKWAALGIGAGGLVAVYIVYRNHQANAAAASSTAAAEDPLTGYPQGSPQDQAALAAQQSATYGGGFGFGGSGGNFGTYPIYSGGSQVGSTTGITYPDNASWAQAVETGLSSIGFSATDVAAALGRYLGRLSLTTDQASIVQAGIAEYGSPPSGTFQIIIASGSGSGTGGGGGGSGGGGGGGGGTTKKPASAPGGLSATGHAGFADFGWGKVATATSYEISIDGASHAVPGNHDEHVALRKGVHQWKVRGVNSAGSGPWSGTRNVTVK